MGSWQEKKKEGFISSVTEYKEQILKKHLKKIFIISGVLAGIMLAVFLTFFIIRKWNYHSYSVITQTSWEKTSSVKYMQAGDNILKYGGDDITLLSRQGNELWNEPYLIENPMVDVCENTGVVYDKKGSFMIVFNETGKVGEIKTKLPVIKAKVSQQGVVAAILEDGETTWINLYDFKGNEIVTSKTRVDSPGYPVDISISKDGMNMAVTYFCVRAYKPSSYVAFYNFGSTGQNQMDNMVNAYTYTDVLVPSIKYFSDSRIVAFRDNGFSLYAGKKIPEEYKTVKIKDTILNIFSNDEYIGVILSKGQGEESYRMELYNKKGEMEWSENLEIPFEKAYISGDEIILYEKNRFAVYSLYGACRYQGKFNEGSIVNIFQIAKNRYMVIMNEGMVTIKLK